MDLLQRKVSFQKDTWSPISHELSIGDVLEAIKNGKYKQHILTLRDFIRNGEKDKYNDHKKRLPAVCFCATFENNRKKEFLKEYNSLVVIDIDKLTYEEMAKIKTSLIGDEHVQSFWESPSGFGIKGIVVLEFETEISKQNVEELHKVAFQKLTNHFLEKHQIELDTSGCDLTRLCFYSYDPNLYENLIVKPFFVSKKEFNEVVLKTDKNKRTRECSKVKVGVDCLLNPKGKNSQRDRVKIQSIIKFLTKSKKSITFDYDNWYRVGYAIAGTFTHDIGEGYYLRLCKLDGFKYNETDSKNMLKYCYANSRAEIHFNTIIHLAELQGYISKKRVVSKMASV